MNSKKLLICLTLLILLKQAKMMAIAAPVNDDEIKVVETETNNNNNELTIPQDEETIRATAGWLSNYLFAVKNIFFCNIENSVPNPIEGLQQIFNPTSGSNGRPMAVLGTFQTLFMPMPSLTEGLQQGQTIINGMNTLGGVFKPIVDGVQSIQQTG